MSFYPTHVDPTKPTTFSAIFKHVSPPTAVDHCLFCNIIHPGLKNLLITRGCFIDIYSLKPDENGGMHFNWVHTTCVFEEISDIVAVRFIGDRLDSLLLSFMEAKVAVMSFDPWLYDLRTLSLHNYEFENLKSGRIHFYRPPILRVDPQQRCAVLLVYERNLAVLPFRRSEVLAAGDKYVSKPLKGTQTSLSWERRATAPLLATFTTCLSSSTGEKINNVIDMQFLHGFYEPTLLVLYEPIGTWAGRVSARRDTCCIVALSFNLQKRTNPVIWFQESLPYDCSYVYSVPQPIGGVLVLATNSVMYLKQTLPSCGLPLNCYAQVTTNFPMRQPVPSCGPLTLDNCRAVAMNDSQFLIAARTGKLYLLSLWVEHATQTVSSLLLHEVGCAVPPHCMALLDSSYLFIGSRLCDSVLMLYEPSSLCVDTRGQCVEPEVDDATGASEPLEESVADASAKSAEPVGDENGPKDGVNTVSEGPKKRVIPHGPYVFDENDVELYGESILNPPSTYREIHTYAFKVADRIVNFGPMGPLTSGEVPCLAPGNTDPTDEALIAAQAEMHHIELVVCIPRSFEDVVDFETDPRAGGVLLLHTSVRPRGLTAFELPEYMSLWSLFGPPIVSPAPSDNAPKETSRPSTESEIERSPSHQVNLNEDPKDAGVTVTETNEEEGETGEKTQVGDQNPAEFSPKTEDEDIGDPVAAKKEDVPMEPQESDEPSKLESDPKAEIRNAVQNRPCVGQTHSYLLLTREDSTMILEVSHEIVELEVSGFNTTEMTVAAFNLGGEYIEKMKKAVNACSENTLAAPTMDTLHDSYSVTQPSTSAQISGSTKTPRAGQDYPYILQVSPTSLRLLDGPKLIEYVQVTLEWRIHLASAADPFVLLCTEDDELFLIRLRTPEEINAATGSNKPSFKKPSFLNLRSAMDLGTTDSSDTFSSTDVQSTSSVHLEVIRPKVGQVSAPLCFCLYHDRAGQLAQWLWKRQDVVDDDSTPISEEPTTVTPVKQFFPDVGTRLTTDKGDLQPSESPDVGGDEKAFPHLSTSDEEDLLLYGEIIELCKKETVQPRVLTTAPLDTSMEVEELMHQTDDLSDKSKYFAFIVFTNGVLEIYGLPEFTLLYEVHHFSDLPAILVDHRGKKKKRERLESAGAPMPEEDSIPPTILEISVFPVGRNKDRPVLIARTSQEIAFFEGLCPPPDEPCSLVSGSWREESLRWRRLPIPCPLVAPRRVRTDPKIADVQSTLLNRANLLRAFENIDGHRGVFVCGATPIWLFATDTGQIRVFPHSIDGIMGSFAPLNTTICPSGFVYFTYSNEMRLATLPPGYSFRENLGMRWIPLELTPYFVQYHVESKTYAVIGTKVEPCTSVFHLNAEGNKEEVVLARPSTCVLPTLDHYVLQMYAPSVTDSPWEPIPHTRLDFDPWEVVTCVVTAQLSSEQTFHGTKDYLALGANLSYGEEIPVRGRILIFDVIDVVPEPGQPLTRHKLKTIYDGEQKGPVTAITSCQGHLISAIGQKVYIWTLKNGDLVGVAFVDSELYIHSLLCVKNLVLAADVLKSIQLLRFQSDLRVLSVVSRDSGAREVYTANFFVDGRRLGFMVSDEIGNVIIYSYDPLDPSSRSGRRFVRRADLRLPSRATSSLRVANRLRHALLSVKSSHSSQTTAPPTAITDGTDQNSATSTSTNQSGANTTTSTSARSQPGGSGTLSSLLANTSDPDRLRHSVYLGTQTGALFLLAPIRDKMYSRLRITEKNLIHYLGPTCGMLPKLCWNYRSHTPELANPCGQVADTDLLWRFLVLPHNQRLEIARKSGQSLEGIMDDIAELNATTLHF
ncbi:unnamed protein product [Calicophoron daubneyi]|uniref:Cleavage and polyadenylation specificity factor subunit 1 n=1 Tax=Calicophoron daubneyi TaxID=300641 RepID=A0AAV2TUM1_CALDB